MTNTMFLLPRLVRLNRQNRLIPVNRQAQSKLIFSLVVVPVIAGAIILALRYLEAP